MRRLSECCWDCKKVFKLASMVYLKDRLLCCACCVREMKEEDNED